VLKCVSRPDIVERVNQPQTLVKQKLSWHVLVAYRVVKAMKTTLKIDGSRSRSSRLWLLRRADHPKYDEKDYEEDDEEDRIPGCMFRQMIHSK